MDVQKFLDRIKFTKPVDNDQTTLKELSFCHSLNVPFDNLDMFGGEKKILNLEKIYKNIVLGNRGGFCYENNGLFHWLLVKCGFEVEMLQGQVYTGEGYGPKFDHLILLVTCKDGTKWLTDVGFGLSCFEISIQFGDSREQQQRNGTYRIMPVDGEKEFILEKKAETTLTENETTTKEETKWRPLYKFDAIPRKWEDFEKMCKYSQESEDGFLKRNSICSKSTENGCIMLWGKNAYEQVFVDGNNKAYKWKKKANNVEEINQLLKEHFQFEIDFDIKPEAHHFKET